MIESAEGLKNINDIAAVPGVAGFYVGDNDLSNSLGVALGSPESEAAIDTIAKACQTHRIACGISAESAEADQARLQDSWRRRYKRGPDAHGRRSVASWTRSSALRSAGRGHRGSPSLVRLFARGHDGTETSR